MSNLLAQLVLARRSPEGDGWMNILVVVVMAVIWMVGAIVKSTKTKSGEKQPPSRKPPAHSRGVQQQMPGRAQRPAGPSLRPGQALDAPKRRTMLSDLREAARKFATEAEQAFQVQTATPKLEAEATPHIAPVIEPAKTLTARQATAASEMLETQHLSDLLSDYADPDKLRRAILHYEILGPPLSLRD